MALRLAIHCPYCKRAVPASPLQLGRAIACPHCRGEFIANASSMSEERAEPQPPPAAANFYPPQSQGAAAPVARLLTAPPLPPNGGAASAHLPVAQAGRAQGASTAKSPIPLPAPAPKTNTARFVADQTQGPTIAPAADGSLPKLQLADSVTESAEQPESRPIPLWLAMLLVIISTGLSTLLLLTDSSETKQQTSKAEARRELERFYGQGDGPLLPYQVHLREAQLAFSRREYAAERRHYRQVLGLLRAEGRGPYVGLAGTPREDEELARLLTILLATE
jgi:hypothetical protein